MSDAKEADPKLQFRMLPDAAMMPVIPFSHEKMKPKMYNSTGTCPRVTTLEPSVLLGTGGDDLKENHPEKKQSRSSHTFIATREYTLMESTIVYLLHGLSCIARKSSEHTQKTVSIISCLMEYPGIYGYLVVTFTD
ncbi:hypothetical protein AVEN_4715-1 [Araneus ventricosus]|uniref:Uncharacterized protein n=1 Tax=Araneus ventricosus TaxID=182803 RepID=A0A4Y2PJT8_ARAVE|nr:hypothetical protein AVEN_4715-1 [Araneus ventricosus]